MSNAIWYYVTEGDQKEWERARERLEEEIENAD